MKSLKLLSFCDRLFLRKASVMFRVYHDKTPPYISEKFTLRNEVNTSVLLRSTASGCFVPPQPRKECYKQSMTYPGCLIWNSLPNDVKSTQTPETFHSRCIKWLTQLIQTRCIKYTGKWFLGPSMTLYLWYFIVNIYIYIYHVTLCGETLYIFFFFFFFFASYVVSIFSQCVSVNYLLD